MKESAAVEQRRIFDIKSALFVYRAKTLCSLSGSCVIE